MPPLPRIIASCGSRSKPGTNVHAGQLACTFAMLMDSGGFLRHTDTAEASGSDVGADGRRSHGAALLSEIASVQISILISASFCKLSTYACV